jgi:hypothetical protein
MLNIIIVSIIIVCLFAVGSWLINRAPSWMFYGFVFPGIVFLLWKVGAVEWLFNA